MIDHLPWIGSEFEKGLDNNRIAIIGYSHWGDNDSEEATVNCVENVISGHWKINFFTTIRNYFGCEDHASFWKQVIFFNYLPNLIGNGEKRFSHGSTDQHNQAKIRFERILGMTKPKKVLVFTSRRWAFPKFERSLLADSFPKFEHGLFKTEDHTANVFFLRHPQGANGQLMRNAVDHILKLSTPQA